MAQKPHVSPLCNPSSEHERSAPRSSTYRRMVGLMIASGVVLGVIVWRGHPAVSSPVEPTTATANTGGTASPATRGTITIDGFHFVLPDHWEQQDRNDAKCLVELQPANSPGTPACIEFTRSDKQVAVIVAEMTSRFAGTPAVSVSSRTIQGLEVPFIEISGSDGRLGGDTMIRTVLIPSSVVELTMVYLVVTMTGTRDQVQAADSAFRGVTEDWRYGPVMPPASHQGALSRVRPLPPRPFPPPRPASPGRSRS